MALKAVCVGVFVLGLAAGSADAAPATGTATILREVGDQISAVETVAARRCWWRNGRRLCAREAAPRAPSRPEPESSYYERTADKLPFGSQRWWEQMSREDRAGRCCN